MLAAEQNRYQAFHVLDSLSGVRETASFPDDAHSLLGRPSIKEAIVPLCGLHCHTKVLAVAVPYQSWGNAPWVPFITWRFAGGYSGPVILIADILFIKIKTY